MIKESARRVDHLVQLALVLLLVVGCWLVLQPFFTAILFALVVALSTWPAYRWLQWLLRGRQQLASAIACAMVVLVVITPAILIVQSFTEGAGFLLTLLEEWFAAGLPQAPKWLERLPMLGPAMQDYWNQTVSSPESVRALLKRFAAPTQEIALKSGRALGIGLFQFVLAVLILYLLYRDGASMARQVRAMAGRLGGDLGRELLVKAQKSVAGVMVSVIGAGLAQAMVATLGFAIAGVPQPFLLGMLTFILSLVPWGPVVIWGGAAVWLFREGEMGWTVFMLLYGWLGISSVDNLLKPYLIARTSHLPFALTIMGVIGGVLAFGVVGLFLGPTLLALVISLAAYWMKHAGRDTQPGDT